MPDTIRVRAVDGAVVFAFDPRTGRLASPLRAIGREGPSAASPAMLFEDAPKHPIVLRAIEARDLEEVAIEPAQMSNAEPVKENS